MMPRNKVDLEEVDATDVSITPLSEGRVTFTALEIDPYDILDQISEETLREYLGDV